VGACPGRDSDEGQVLRGRRRCHDRMGPVASDRPEGVRALADRLVDVRRMSSGRDGLLNPRSLSWRWRPGRLLALRLARADAV
jgi:hypothetical protein